MVKNKTDMPKQYQEIKIENKQLKYSLRYEG